MYNTPKEFKRQTWKSYLNSLWLGRCLSIWRKTLFFSMFIRIDKDSVASTVPCSDTVSECSASMSERAFPGDCFWWVIVNLFYWCETSSISLLLFCFGFMSWPRTYKGTGHNAYDCSVLTWPPSGPAPCWRVLVCVHCPASNPTSLLPCLLVLTFWISPLTISAFDLNLGN